MAEDLLEWVKARKTEAFQPTRGEALAPLNRETWRPLAQLIAKANPEQLALFAAGEIMPLPTGELADREKWKRAHGDMVQYAKSLQETRAAATGSASEGDMGLSSRPTVDGFWKETSAPVLPAAENTSALGSAAAASRIAPATDGELGVWGHPPEKHTAQDDEPAPYHGRHAREQFPAGSRHAAAEVGGTALSLHVDASGTVLQDLRTSGRHAADPRPISITIPLPPGPVLEPYDPGSWTIHDTPRPSSN